MNLSARAQARLLVEKTKAAGAVLPKPIAAAYERVSRSNEAMSYLRPTENPQALGEAVAAALTDRRDPAADPEVQRILTARSLVQINVSDQLEAALQEEFRETCREHADAFVKALRKPFDTAASDLAAAAEVIGSKELEDAPAILALGGDAGQAWVKAKDSFAVVDTVVFVWSTLLAFARLGQANPHQRALRIAAIDYGTWARLGLDHEGSKQDPWTLARAGVALSLPTFKEYRDRVQTVADGHADAVRAQDRRNTALMAGRNA